jgi:hypothetical protein
MTITPKNTNYSYNACSESTLHHKNILSTDPYIKIQFLTIINNEPMILILYFNLNNPNL